MQCVFERYVKFQKCLIMSIMIIWIARIHILYSDTQLLIINSSEMQQGIFMGVLICWRYIYVAPLVRIVDSAQGLYIIHRNLRKVFLLSFFFSFFFYHNQTLHAKAQL